MEKTLPIKQYKILVVDDSRSIIRRLSSILTMKGYEVRSTTNPVEAYEILENEHFDIVISDIEMPEMNGLDLLRKIKNHNGMVQIIIVTSFITINNVLNTFRYGAINMIFKPFKSKELIDAVQEAVNKIERVALLLDQCMRMKEKSL